MPAYSKREQQILQWFEDHKDAVVTPRALSIYLNIPHPTVKSLLRKLLKERKIIQVSFGLYAHPSFKSSKNRK